MCPHHRSPTDPWTPFALAVFRTNALINEAGDDIVEPIGQSSARWQILGRVHEPRTVSALAREIGHARQSVQRVTDILADERLVAYTTHPTDRRTKLVELMPAGAQVMSAIYARQIAWSQGVMAELNAEDLTEITDALHAISEVLAALTAAHRDATPRKPRRDL